MANRTGILNNSPLIFTLASVRFAAWPLMAKKIDEIHDELRDTLPLIRKIQVQPVGSNGQAVPQSENLQPSSWVLVSGDRSHGIQLSPDQLLVFSKTYSRYSDFENNLKKYLSVLIKHMRFMDVTDLGVRYVDHIKVRAGEQLGDYVSNLLLPGVFSGLQLIGGMNICNYKSGDVELRVRCISHPGALSIPEDLVPTLLISQEGANSLQIKMLDHNELLLDMDAIKNNVSPVRMDSEPILMQLNSLHDVANAFFRHEDVCKAHAFEVWGE